MAELFNVVFAGEIVGRADPAVVRANVGKLFGASEAVLDKLFSGQPVAIKKMVDRATAMQLRARLKQAGAEARMVAVDEQGKPLAAAPGAAPPAVTPAGGVAPAAPVRPVTAAAAATPAAVPSPPATPAPAPALATPVATPSARPAAPAAAAPEAAGGSMAARLQALAREQALAAASAPPASALAATGSWDLKPVGTRLSDPLPPPPPAPDTSAISLKAPGGDLVSAQELPHAAPVRVDISGLSMAAAGTEVLRDDERPRVEPVKVDLSGMSMAEVGAPLDEIHEDKPLVNPDISHIKLAD